MNHAPPGAAHFDRPGDAAAHIVALPAVIITGPDLLHAATLAVAVARAAATARRVAIGDLVGHVGPIYALAGGSDAVGLAECFRDGLSLNEIARPVTEAGGLFVLPSGAGVDREPALGVPGRWERLIRGFAEAGGLLILVCHERSPLIAVLGAAGASLLYDGRPQEAPAGAPLAGTLGAVPQSGTADRPHRRPQRGVNRVRGWHMASAAVATTTLVGWAAVARVRASHAPNGSVAIHPLTTVGATPAAGVSGTAAPDTVQLIERTPASDRSRLAPFAIAVVAASTAANANSFVREHRLATTEPAATISVLAVPGGGQRASRWHKVMFGAWPDEASATAALAEARRRGVLDKGDGAVVRVPYGVLLAEGASPERARAVMEVWEAKGVTPYALVQDDGTVRVYAGAFETVAQAVTMAAMVDAAGGGPIVAYRTGRPD